MTVMPLGRNRVEFALEDDGPGIPPRPARPRLRPLPPHRHRPCPPHRRRRPRPRDRARDRRGPRRPHLRRQLARRAAPASPSSCPASGPPASARGASRRGGPERRARPNRLARQRAYIRSEGFDRRVFGRTTAAMRRDPPRRVIAFLQSFARDHWFRSTAWVVVSLKGDLHVSFRLRLIVKCAPSAVARITSKRIGKLPTYGA